MEEPVVFGLPRSRCLEFRSHAWMVMHAPGDVRVEQRDDPKIIDPTDAVDGGVHLRLGPVAVPGRVEKPDGADADGPRVRGDQLEAEER
jgi:hypothetical protein